MKRLIVPTAIVLVFASLPALASSSATLLPNGTPIDVTLDAPFDGTEYVVPSISGTVDVDVEGTASVGFGSGDATVVYVLDVSGSVENDSLGDCGGDLNADAIFNSILDCQIAGLLALNQAAINSGSVDEVGLAVYGRRSQVADMTPGGGDDPTTTPDAGPGDVGTVLTSVVALAGQAGPTQFTPKDADRGRTNFSAGVAAATTIVGASSNTTNIVVFLSDGLSNDGAFTEFSDNVAALGATGAVAHSFAVGQAASCAGGNNGTLQAIADGTGGTCTQVSNPADLADVIFGLLSSTLDSLELSVDGGAPVTIPNGDISLPLPQDGPIAVTYSTPANGLGVGSHTMCVTAFGADAGGPGDSGPACTTVSVYAIDLAPPDATKELGVDTTHTVTATIAGEAGTVGGRLVTFTIVDGPNTGTTGTCTLNLDCTADAAGNVSWTYTNTGGGGTDVIQACFTVADPTGQTGCARATVLWADTTPPLAACLPGPNPHGQKIPPAGSSSLPGPKGGQNEDGFYDLAAEDLVDPSPQVYAVDEGTGFVFGPYPAGTIVKWTQAPGAPPAEKKMGSDKGQAGAVDWHLRGQGDMLIYAVDASGNASDPLVCLVPPLPK
ncbi:MAG: VWA domain-containing protein [Acidimicrobiia bacterium]|nr:VWA domain-containing protein [Acidimicrobiia bacterium]